MAKKKAVRETRKEMAEDMVKAKDGDFFIADWLRNRNTIEFLGIWETVYNTGFNHVEFATIKTPISLNFRLFDWSCFVAMSIVVWQFDSTSLVFLLVSSPLE